MSKNDHPVEYYYHATYLEHLPSIINNGLGPTPDDNKNYDRSKDNAVYLSIDPHVAESFADTAEDVPEAWLDEIVVIQIPADRLDLTKLSVDANIILSEGEAPFSFEYAGTIPVTSDDVMEYSEMYTSITAPAQRF